MVAGRVGSGRAHDTVRVRFVVSGTTPVGNPYPRGASEVETAKVGSELVSHPLNHGWFVSQAAKAVTPAGFDNHGAYVSSIARSDQGKPTTAATATTASDPGARGEAKSAAAKAKAAVRKAARQQP